MCTLFVLLLSKFLFEFPTDFYFNSPRPPSLHPRYSKNIYLPVASPPKDYVVEIQGFAGCNSTAEFELLAESYSFVLAPMDNAGKVSGQATSSSLKLSWPVAVSPTTSCEDMLYGIFVKREDYVERITNSTMQRSVDLMLGSSAVGEFASYPRECKKGGSSIEVELVNTAPKSDGIG